MGKPIDGSEASPRAKEVGKRWPEIFVRWENVEVPMKGTPFQANEPERGSIKNLRLTETDRRKRTAASKQRANSPQKQEAKKVAPKAAAGAGSSAGTNGTTSSPAGGAGTATGASNAPTAAKSPRSAGAKPATSSAAPPLPLPMMQDVEDGPGDGPPPSIVVHLMLGPPKRMEQFVSVDSRVSGSGNSGGEGDAWDLVTSPVANNGENGTTVGMAEASSVVEKLRGLVDQSRKEMGEDLASEVKQQLEAWKVAKNGNVPSPSLVSSMQACYDGVVKRQQDSIRSLVKLCEASSSAHFVATSLLQASRRAEENIGCAAARETLLAALDEVMLTKGNSGAPPGPSPQRTNELLELVRRAEFHDARLDYTCRRLLGVQMTAAATAAAAERPSWDI